jgi:hypothetical protein
MRLIAVVAAVFVAWPAGVRAEDLTARVKKAVERSTLDQPGTKPFHLKAELAPSRERDKDSGRTGEVEIWWAGPGKWRREVRSPEFHQIEIIDGAKDWQKNEGDYFPEWLRETAVALVKPVPDLGELLQRVKTADVKTLMGSTYISWVTTGSDGTVSQGIGASFAITDSTGLEFYGGDVGWDGLFKDYQEFHGRMVARTVSNGSPEVTAKVSVLEDLKDTPQGFFDAGESGSDPILQTKVVDELTVRKNLLPVDALVWPPLENGPLKGASIADVVLDREGRVQEVGTAVANNPGVRDTFLKYVQTMRFKPYVVDGLPVQVVTTITMPFKTVRPAGVESFESARTYFERGRKASFPAAGTGPAYMLQAKFTTRGSSGTVETGTYTDTWVSDSQWRREATFGASRFVRSRNGDKRYRLTEGPDAKMLGLVLMEMEPIPAIDTFTESDWRIKRDVVDGLATIRVAMGPENPDGTPDPEHFVCYWFDETGLLVKSYGNAMETRRSQFTDFNGIKVARRIDGMYKGNLVLRVDVTELGAAGTVDKGMFTIKGHEWVRQFTSEVR